MNLSVDSFNRVAAAVQDAVAPALELCPAVAGAARGGLAGMLGAPMQMTWKDPVESARESADWDRKHQDDRRQQDGWHERDRHRGTQQGRTDERNRYERGEQYRRDERRREETSRHGDRRIDNGSGSTSARRRDRNLPRHDMGLGRLLWKILTGR